MERRSTHTQRRCTPRDAGLVLLDQQGYLPHRPSAPYGRKSGTMSSLAEIEDALTRLSAQPGVLGTLVATADGAPVRSSLDPALAAEYGALFSGLAARARVAVRELDASDELTFLRVRTRRGEVLVAPAFDPGRQYFLLVVQSAGQE